MSQVNTKNNQHNEVEHKLIHQNKKKETAWHKKQRSTCSHIQGSHTNPKPEAMIYSRPEHVAAVSQVILPLHFLPAVKLVSMWSLGLKLCRGFTVPPFALPQK